MITGLDHVAVVTADFDAVTEGYRRLLDVEPRLEDGGGAMRAWFRFPNMALEVIAPDGAGPAGDRVRARLAGEGPGLWILAFAVGDVDAAARLAERRGLTVAVRTDKAALIDVGGVRISLIADPKPAKATGLIPGLDHVVIRTANIDRAVANFGGRLGLDLRLDRANEAWGARQLFFRCGEAVLEFAASLKHPPSDGPDSFGGLAWRVTDPDAVRARLAAEGFDVSELRTGRKPGTKVFTVRDAPAGVPTLMLSAEPLPEPA
jgi:catechol 2,3-dioxygenase-like lactoylglutathione lyase family enzyme